MAGLRQRWYALHRARRQLRRSHEEALKRAWALPPEPGEQIRRRVLDLLVNPPIVYDPVLNEYAGRCL